MNMRLQEKVLTKTNPYIAYNKPMNLTISRRFCVAPMMGYTNRHFRYLLRLISRRAMLYTEMLSSHAILNGERSRLLDFSEQEHPLALQVGGSCAKDMARCAEYAELWGYDEININVGCPSSRVGNAQFGACLMKTPQRVASCVEAMSKACNLPISVKCRIGIDDQNDYAQFYRFIDCVAAAGCEVFIVHARNALLGKLSPKQNREIPPLNYEYVYRLKAERPDLQIILNGGLQDIDTAYRQLTKLDGVMLGRAVQKNPFILHGVDALYYDEYATDKSRTPVAIAKLMLLYIERQINNNAFNMKLLHTIQNLFKGYKHTKKWRRMLSEEAAKIERNRLVGWLDRQLELFEPEQCIG